MRFYLCLETTFNFANFRKTNFEFVIGHSCKLYDINLKPREQSISYIEALYFLTVCLNFQEAQVNSVIANKFD